MLCWSKGTPWGGCKWRAFSPVLAATEDDKVEKQENMSPVERALHKRKETHDTQQGQLVFPQDWPGPSTGFKAIAGIYSFYFFFFY